MSSKYGHNKLMNSSEMVQILNQLPVNSTICDPRIKRKRLTYNQYNYIDTYMTHRNIKLVDTCQTGNYLVHPKRIMLIKGNFLNDRTYKKTYFVKSVSSGSTNLWPIFKVEKSNMVARKSKLFLETKTAYVYCLLDSF
jgi:hypothetical protein